MNAIELAVSNFQEVRRRSTKLWRSLPDEWLTWKPDDEAFSFGETIRHVWTAQVYYHESLKLGRSVTNYEEPYEHEPVESVEIEIFRSIPYFEDFICFVRSLSEEELMARELDRSNIGYIRTYGDMLNRIAYHESVHSGQFLQCMRSAGIPRPNIWD